MATVSRSRADLARFTGPSRARHGYICTWTHLPRRQMRDDARRSPTMPGRPGAPSSQGPQCFETALMPVQQQVLQVCVCSQAGVSLQIVVGDEPMELGRHSLALFHPAHTKKTGRRLSRRAVPALAPFWRLHVSRVSRTGDAMAATAAMGARVTG